MRIACGKCEVTGITFEFGVGEGRSPHAPSIDRIASHGGYTMNNCRVVIWHLNAALNQYGDDALYALAEALVARRRQVNRTRNKGNPKQ